MVRRQGTGIIQSHVDNQGYVANQVSTNQKLQSHNQGTWKNRSPQRFPANRTNLFCTHCKKTNHIRENCYRLIGFPPDFKFTNTKPKKFQPAIKSNVVSTEKVKGANYCNSNMGQFLTKEEYAQAVQYYKGNKTAESSGSTIPTDTNATGNANTETGITYTHAFTCLATKNSSSWIIDTGAS